MFQSIKSSALRTIIIAPLTLLAFPGCQATDESPEPGNGVVITRITAEDTRDSNANIVVSTENRGEALMFDPAQGAIAYDQIDLVCPNGLQMGMTEWLAQLETTVGLDVDALTAQEFTLASSRGDAVAALVKPAPEASAKPEGTESNLVDDGCRCYSQCVVEDCYLCPDGVWVCNCLQWETVCDYGGYCNIPVQ